jgi:hypothetical protein
MKMKENQKEKKCCVLIYCFFFYAFCCKLNIEKCGENINHVEEKGDSRRFLHNKIKKKPFRSNYIICLLCVVYLFSYIIFDEKEKVIAT